MRTIYLLRHCEPDVSAYRSPSGETGTVCLGSEDPPLSKTGRIRGALLALFFRERKTDAFFCSDKRRSRETASYLSPSVQTEAGLREISMGNWEGLSFAEIRSRFPGVYEERGRHPFTVFPEGAEAPAAALDRFARALQRVVSRTEVDPVVVAHGGVNRLLLTKLSGKDMEESLHVVQTYGCINTLLFDETSDDMPPFSAEDPEAFLNQLRIKEQSYVYAPALSDAVCETLLEAADTPAEVRAHGRAVAECCEELADRLSRKGILLDRNNLRAAALLHDILRTQEHHAAAGGELLKTLGYPETGALIAAHHDLPEDRRDTVDAKDVLYLADKLIDGTKRVTVEQRFAKSLAKCYTREAKEAHAERLKRALRLEQSVFS